MIAQGKQRFHEARARLKGPAWVAPEALNVSPEVLGYQLARPGRRLLAIGIDLLLVAMLSGASNLWLVAGLVLLGFQLRKRQASTTSTQRKWLLWLLCLAFLWLGVQHGRDFWEDRQDDERSAASAADPAKSKRARDREVAKQAKATAAAIKQQLEAEDKADHSGMSPEDREAARAKLVANAVLSALATRPASAPASASASASDAIPALPTASRAAPAAEPASGAAPSAKTDAERIAQLEEELEEARKPKSFNWKTEAKRWLDSLGVGFGWAIVYFSLVPAWLQGQTLGKKLLGLRVVELTGKPLNVMTCFSRYGGYAAGMATGMVGFAQVLWDVNRQAIQDKIAHTVVVDLRAPRRGTSDDAAAATPTEPVLVQPMAQEGGGAPVPTASEAPAEPTTPRTAAP